MSCCSISCFVSVVVLSVFVLFVLSVVVLSVVVVYHQHYCQLFFNLLLLYLHMFSLMTMMMTMS